MAISVTASQGEWRDDRALPAMNVSAGSLIVVVVGYDRTSAGTCSISDTAGNTYTEIGSALTTSTKHLRMFYCENCAGHASNVISASIQSGFDYDGMAAIVATDIATSSALDATETVATTSNTLTTGTFSTSQADTLLVIGSYTGGPTYTQTLAGTAGTNVTLTGSATARALAYRIASSQVSSGTGVVTTDNVAGAARIAAFKASGGGGGSTFTPQVIMVL